MKILPRGSGFMPSGTHLYPAMIARTIAIAGAVLRWHKRKAVPTTGVGTVIWFDPQGGYGFVKPDDGGPDTFVRLSSKAHTAVFAAGERVSYQLLTSGEPAKTEAVIIAKAI